jgi:uncharacterized membrane protein
MSAVSDNNAPATLIKILKLITGVLERLTGSILFIFLNKPNINKVKIIITLLPVLDDAGEILTLEIISHKTLSRLP